MRLGDGAPAVREQIPPSAQGSSPQGVSRGAFFGSWFGARASWSKPAYAAADQPAAIRILYPPYRPIPIHPIPRRCTIHPEITLRPIRDDDMPFLFQVYASTRTEELAPVPWTDQQKLEFLAMQFHAQHEHYMVHYAEAEFSVVLVDGEPAGRLYLYRGERDLRLVDIALLPQFRGNGLGSRLLHDVLEEGDRTGKTVSIHVEFENPARRLYDRLGFVPAGEAGVYVLMERPPATPAPAAD